MIGRREELAAFEAACAAVHEGAGRCVLVTGEAGIGKTRLAPTRSRTPGSRPTAARRARPWPSRTTRSRRCCASACGRRPTRRGLRARSRRTSRRCCRSSGSRPWTPGRRRWSRRCGARSPRWPRDGPVAVVLDDLHWADEATLLLLPAHRRRSARDAAAAVALARDEVPADTHRLRRLRAQLRRVCEPVELPLRPLEREDTARLAEAVAREELDDDVVAVLHERSHGIPFYVEQLATALARDGRGTADVPRPPLPETLLDAVLLRTDALSLAARSAPRARSRLRPALGRSQRRPTARTATRSPRRWPPDSWSRRARPPRVPPRARPRCDLRGDPVDPPPGAACVASRASSRKPARPPPSAPPTGSAPARSRAPATR